MLDALMALGTVILVLLIPKTKEELREELRLEIMFMKEGLTRGKRNATHEIGVQR